MSLAPTVVGLGEILWDELPEGRQLGGAPANFAFHAGQLGAKAVVVSRIGDDQDGHDIQQKLEELELPSVIQVDSQYPTGKVMVRVDAGGEPVYDIKENVAWDYIDLTGELLTLANSCDAVCFGSLAQRSAASAESIRLFLENTREKSLRVFDINLRQAYYSQQVVEQSLQLSNVVKFNQEEFGILRKMFGLSADEKVFIREFIDRFELKVLILTKGGEGSYLADPDQTSYLHTSEVEVADTIGAGDSFTAAVVMGLLEGKKITEIHRKAIDLSAFVCSQEGAMPGHELRN